MCRRRSRLPARAVRVAALSALLLLVTLVPVFTQERADVVRTRSGEMVEGILVEESPDSHLLIRSEDGVLVYLPPSEVLAVDHGSGSRLSDAHEDILLLTNGLVLRGAIREDAPGDHVGIEVTTELGDALVTVPYDELWKILRRPLPEPGTVDAAAEREAVTLRLQITLGQRRAGGSAESGDEDEIARLVSELEEVENARARVENDACEERREAESEKVESSAETAREAIDELASIAAMCENGATRSKGDDELNDEEVPEAPAIAALMSEDPTGYERWSIDDTAEELRASTLALAEQAASPAGDPAVLAALRERFETRATVQMILSPRVGVGPVQHLRVRVNARSLSLPDRELLYAANRRNDQFLGVGLNLIPGLGLGSLAQRDIVGFAVNAGIVVAGGVLMWAGYEYAEHMIPIETELGLFRIPESMTLVYIGTGVIGGAYVFSLARPFVFVNRCNTLLRDSLDVRP
jgi:hypothetical protein